MEKEWVTVQAADNKEPRFVIDEYLYMARGEFISLQYNISIYENVEARILLYNNLRYFEDYLRQGNAEYAQDIRMVKGSQLIKFTSFDKSEYYFVAIEIIDQPVHQFSYKRTGKRMVYDATGIFCILFIIKY